MDIVDRWSSMDTKSLIDLELSSEGYKPLDLEVVEVGKGKQRIWNTIYLEDILHCYGSQITLFTCNFGLITF